MSNYIKEIYNDVLAEPMLGMEEIKSGLISTAARQRLRAFLHIRRRIEQEKDNVNLFDLAAGHIEDSDNNCRWQSIVIISEYLFSRRENVWEIILKYGSWNDEDMRIAISNILLEEYLSNNITDFEKKLNIIRNEIKAGNRNLRDTLSHCWIEFATDEQEKMVQKILSDTQD